MQLVSESFKLSAVVGDGEAPLVQVVEFHLVEDDALHLVVVVEVVDGRPEGEGVCLPLGRADDAHHLDGAGDVYPIDNAAINLVPVNVKVNDQSGGRDERVKAKFAEGRVEEHPPVIVVGIRELQNDGNTRANVHS
jgi:hypothetical protein